MRHTTMSTRRGSLTKLATLVALLSLAGPLGCRRRPPEDPVLEQARAAERDGRARLRDGTDLAICDATLLFARERHIGRSASDRRWARRGENLVARWAPRCQQRIERFWASHEGCATPIRGRELDTFVYWDGARIAAFQQYGVPGVAVAMSSGRNRWQTSCPADYAAAAAQEGVLRAQAPLPVPITTAPATAAGAAPPAAASDEAQQALYQAVTAMAHGNYQEALTALQALRASGATPIITFNIAVCLDQLGQSDQAIETYRQVASDPTFGPRAAARIRILGGEAAPAPSDAATATAREAFQRGLQLAEAGRYEEAIEAFNRSFAAVPHPRTVLNIAISYHRLGQVEAAISHYQLVVEDEELEESLRRTAMEAIEQLAGADAATSPTVAGSPASP